MSNNNLPKKIKKLVDTLIHEDLERRGGKIILSETSKELTRLGYLDEEGCFIYNDKKSLALYAYMTEKGYC